MKILLISWSFPPTAGPRAIKADAIARELLQRGHTVSLITRDAVGDFDTAILTRLRELVLMPTGEWLTLPVKLHASETGLGTSWIFRKMNGLLYKLLCYPGIGALVRTRKALSRLNEQKFDFTLSIDGPQPMHWAVARERARNPNRLGVWVADCGDPLLRVSPGNKPARYFRLIENWFLTKADYITVPVPQGTTYFEARFKEKIHTVPHSLSFPESRSSQRAAEHAFDEEAIRFAYAGNLAPYRERLLEFCECLPNEAAFEFHVFGENERIIEDIKTRFSHLRRKIFYWGSVPRLELLVKLQSFKFLVLFTYESGLQVPFKLIDYSFVNRPILLFNDDHGGKEGLKAFLAGDFRRGFSSVDFRRHDASNTVPQYLAFVEKFYSIKGSV